MSLILSRRRLLKSAAVLAAVSPLTGLIPKAYAETTFERAKSQGFIRVGFANEAPFGFATPDGKLTGEAPEVAKVVLAKIGIAQVDGVLTEFGSLIPGLKAGRFNPKGIKDYSSIKENADLKLAVMAGAVEAGYAKDAGVPETQLVVLPDQSSLLAAVQSGRADAAALTALSIAEMAKKGEGVESTKPFGEVAGKSVKGHGGFGFRKEDTDLLDAFNSELKKFIGTPEHIALVTPFGFGEDYLPSKSTEQLCKGE
jgi:polar amino acid transport system substrate-binding protein